VERAVELYACIQFVVIGLSHLLQPRAWVEFFVLLRGKGHAGVFANAFLSLLFGSFIVSFHNVWTGWPVVLTLLGWAQVIKATMSFIAPQIGMRGMQRVAIERAWEFQVAGIFFLILAGVMGYVLLRA
jgi:hypothetical protein